MLRALCCSGGRPLSSLPVGTSLYFKFQCLLLLGFPGLLPLLTCDPAITLQSLEVICGSQDVKCLCVLTFLCCTAHAWLPNGLTTAEARIQEDRCCCGHLVGTAHPDLRPTKGHSCKTLVFHVRYYVHYYAGALRLTSMHTG